MYIHIDVPGCDCKGGADNSPGREVSGNNAELARLIGVDSSVVSRRFESGRSRMNDSTEMETLVNEVRRRYKKRSLRAKSGELQNCTPGTDRE